MHIRSFTPVLAPLFAALLSILLIPSAASAQGLPMRAPTAEEILRQTLAKYAASVDRAGERIDDLVERAVFRIERAASKGASRASLERTASKAVRSLPSVGRKALAQINRDMGRAMIRMRTAEGYEREMQATLEFEREVAIADLEDLIEQASARIDEALASE